MKPPSSIETEVAAKSIGCRCRRVRGVDLHEVIRKRAPQEKMVQTRCK